MEKDFMHKINQFSFEEALAELEKIVTKLENGSETLENAIKNYEYGNSLRKYCENKLNESKLRIEKITQNEEGLITTEPIQID